MTQKRLRVLLAEADSSETTEALRALYPETEKGMELTVVSTVATLLATIGVVKPEIILLDLSMSLREPRDAVHLVHRTAPGVPLIVIAESARKEQAERSLTQGAMDYVLRGSIDLQRLARVLSAALERNSLQRVTELLRDPLTELYTRDGLLAVGSRRQDEAHGNGGALVLVCALFDNLQTLREELGPGAAERALHDVASLLKGCCRRSDVVARLGEAHFAILGVDAAAPSAQVMRNRLEQHLTVRNRTRSPQDAVELRTSIGSWSAQDERSFAEFLDSVQSQLVLAPMGMKTKSVPEGNRIRV
jgi:two-component system cell cycle response regulator